MVFYDLNIRVWADGRLFFHDVVDDGHIFANPGACLLMIK
jgi:hypothetical protein